MFSNPLVQVALCIVLEFLIMSAIVSVLQQIAIQFFRMRSHNLRKAIHGLIADDAYKLEIVKRFYQHPLTASLSGGEARATSMDAMTFITALSTAVQPRWSTGEAIATLPASVAALQEGELKRRLTLILPPPGSSREEIITALTNWFNAADAKKSQRFTANVIGLGYGIATTVTLLFNVSTIHIAESLHSNQKLASAVASLTPTLAAAVNQRSSDLNTSIENWSPTSPSSTSSAATAAEAGKDIRDLQTIVACARMHNELPVGWPWMADLIKQGENALEIDGDLAACGKALAAVDTSPALKEHVAVLRRRVDVAPKLSAKAAQSKAVPVSETYVPTPVATVVTAAQYGPDFRTESAWKILLGWLITIVASAQGAPFWFNAIRRVIGR